MGTYAEAKERYYKNLYKTGCTFEEWLRNNTNVSLNLCLFIKHPNKDGYFFSNFKEKIGSLAFSMFKSYAEHKGNVGDFALETFKSYAELEVKHVFVITEGDSEKIHMYLEP